MAPSALAVTAFFAVALLPRATWPLIDPDVWWHIRAGQAALTTGIPRVDTWSLTAAGHPWTSQDWQANVVMSIMYAIGPWGETLLSLLFALLAVAAFVVLWKAIGERNKSAGWLGRITWLSAGLILAGPTLGVRVQVFDLLLTAVVVWLLWRIQATRQVRWAVGLPVVTVVWVNLHAGWPLLFLLGGAVVVGELIDRALHRDPRAKTPLGTRELVVLASGLTISTGALILNPNGVDIYRYPLDTLALATLKGAIGEWQPATLDNLFGWLLLGFVVIGVVPALVFGRERLRTSDVLILLGLTVMSVLAIRFLLVLGPVGGSIIALSLAPAISQSRVGQASAPILHRLGSPRSGRLGVLNLVLSVVLLLAGVSLALARSLPDVQGDEIAREQPVAAVGWINANDPGHRVFNRYEWGGYLGLHRPREPIYIDGRADVYGDEIIAEYVRTIGLSVDPQVTFDRYAIDYVLYPPDTALAEWLDSSSGWRAVYRDSVAAVWVRT